MLMYDDVALFRSLIKWACLWHWPF